MEYRVLGSLEAASNGQLMALGPPKERAVLAILLLHAGEIVPTDRLIELAWGERPPRTATHSIQIYVSALRKAIERSGETAAIVTSPPGYMLGVDPEQIDSRRFERLVEQGNRLLDAGDSATAAALFREALDLWRGPPLSDFPYEEFAQEEIRRLESLHVDALEHLAEAELALGHGHAALMSAESAIDEDALRERPRELCMLALYRSGRQPEALRAYQDFDALLSSELGTEPSPRLRRLQERILLHDPALEPIALPPAAAPVRNPYKGLRPFREEDAGDFFGREAFVAGIGERLAGGARLLALVGPSGCGKSSLMYAGLIPALHRGAAAGSDRWSIVPIEVGGLPLEELDRALRTPAGPRPSDGDATAAEAARPLPSSGGRILLVIDQFEGLFGIDDEPVTVRFLDELAAAVADPTGAVDVVLALRADFYDRPLRHPSFAPIFAAGVVNVLPMTADGLEAAVVEPARRVGVNVEPALVAELTTDTATRPGGLPLLQYALTELFERRSASVLSLEEYQAIGGLRDFLSRRAEELYAGLSEDRRAVAFQVFLRLVRVADGPALSRRRVPLRELTSLQLDPVALSEVLDAFGRQRMLSFDRDPGNGDATVEVAHEAIFSEWARLAEWIDQHRADLRQHAALVAAADEWEASGRHPDYLLIGSRLEDYEAWSRDTAVRLTAGEREFLDAAVDRRRAEAAEEAARQERQQRLERRARTRLWGLLTAIALLAAGATFAALSWFASRPPDVALLVEGTGDQGFGDMAVAAVERAANAFGVRYEVTPAKAQSNEVETELSRLSDSGVHLVVVGIGSLAEPVTAAVANVHPGTRYVVWENGGDVPDNVTNITFRSEEGAYLAGAAAALKSQTGIIGFIGAWNIPIIDAYLAGYEAGARSVDPDIEIRPDYLAPVGDRGAFSSPTLGAQKAAGLYAEGADVIFAVAKTSNYGVFATATATSNAQGRQLWAIGVDTDEYYSVLTDPTAVPDGSDPKAWQRHILTSVTKQLDVAIYACLQDFTRGELSPGARSFGLAEGGVDISDSGGFIDDMRPQLQAIRSRILSGQIKVPTVSTSAVQVIEAP